ncbi:phosphoribosyltransferase family protein [Corynebacterium sp. MSK297]|uniref:ComF family protein n=1 Tax=Corynebacterium sp. MSK297 TaxID=3050221 RepID=UPI00254F9980|nr:phosphoribosyltransferase family protein [Corynebacterium sp. MSK297]MDK8846304.1 phosphoribosyltransferase family protein [Corynebacterium sp. MSK297]
MVKFRRRAGRAGFIELVLPRACAGCGAPGQLLCRNCRMILAQPPRRITPRADVLAPVYSCGGYGGPHREVILEMKERNNRAIRPHIAAVLRAALETLQARGEFSHRLVLVPAPTRARSARLRGGDPITQLCTASGFPTWQAVRLAPAMPDQSGLNRDDRLHNVRGNIQLVRPVPRGAEVVVVDDVIATGATLAATVDMLTFDGADVAGCVVLAAA